MVLSSEKRDNATFSREQNKTTVPLLCFVTSSLNNTAIVKPHLAQQHCEKICGVNTPWYSQSVFAVDICVLVCVSFCLFCFALLHIDTYMCKCGGQVQYTILIHSGKRRRL